MLRFSFGCLRPHMRTSFHHQPEAQHPNSSAIHKLASRLPHLSGVKRPSVSDCQTIAIHEYTPFCNGPVDVNCSPIVTPPSSRFCPWSTLRPPHRAVRGSGEPI